MSDTPPPFVTDRPTEREFDPDIPPRATKWPLHPSLGWAVLWCIALVFWSQIPGGILSALVLVASLFLNPNMQARNTTEFLASPMGQIVVSVGILVAHGIIFVLALILLRILAGRDWRREVALRPPAWHQPLIVLLMFPAFTILSAGLYHLIRKAWNVPSFKDFGMPGMEDMEKAFGAWPPVLAVFLIGVVPAFSEEFWCRAYLGRGLVGIYGYILGVLFTSLLFGAIHIDPAQGAMAAGMGVILHVIYLWTRSLWIPMWLHFLNNASAVLLARVPSAGELEKGIGWHHWPIFATAGALLATGLLALWSGRTRLVTPPGEEPWVPPHPGVACPPAGSTTRLEAPAPPLAVAGLVVLALAALAGTIRAAL